jgi:putative ABC transport system ATP-binding protein
VTMEPDLARCDGVSRWYGHNVAAVRDASCAVRAGDRIALTGPSGSGKSTLLHVLAGLDKPSGGQVSWPGLRGNPTHQPGLIGLVFQGPSLLPPLTVLENVALPLVLTGVDDGEARRRAIAALSEVDDGELTHRLPDELSGGQAQRAAIARVLALAPPLILADEPTAQLDSAHVQQVVEALLRVAEQTGAGLVVTTHDPRVAKQFTRQWHMRAGRLSIEELAC